ncbi:hypothetical protein MTR_5g027085 [Medicago truncatula]|uniref:Uncharacterized protein n=1 Tax=Medicago truncatula TaxID=3880 RepID=A0A072UEY6_MEDTR|nr:hypothetical protein MTR_5g027085 [Medicago truncatula]
MSATKPLCLFCNSSNFVGDHRAGVHLCRAGKVIQWIAKEGDTLVPVIHNSEGGLVSFEEKFQQNIR